MSSQARLLFGAGIVVILLAARSASAEQVVWRQTINTTASHANLKKTAGCSDCQDASALSSKPLRGPGGYQFIVSGGQDVSIGLTRLSRVPVYSSDLDYGFTIHSDDTCEIREAGGWKSAC